MIKDILEQAQEELELSESALAEYISPTTARQQFHQWRSGVDPDPVKLAKKIRRHLYAADLLRKILYAEIVPLVAASDSEAVEEKSVP